ncbi:Gfo/Idh/MocA family protein [Parasediminibacterium paludis]|uniref:Gfo/Idh/MocA family protein n=1 Tax=Parasediminibacterium paludis TaxID=908966 RepID=A0ABV8PY55_9BACT
MKRKLRMGMIGGGRNAFIGAVHRIAANIDGLIELTCGALSSNEENAKLSGKDLFLADDRIYTSYADMITKESQLPADVRMDFVSIVTPNHLHFEPAMMALAHGFHVVIDKPLSFDYEQAVALQKKVAETGLLLAVTHTYSGYPMLKQAKQMIAEGAFGKIRKIYIEYPQGWLSNFVESSGSKQAAWRTDPKRSGIAGCMGDIGTHAAHLAEYVSGLHITHLCADLQTFVEGRHLDDDGNVLLKFNNGATGVLIASQVAAGEENAIRLRVYGEKGGVDWCQVDSNTLLVKWLDKPTEIYRTGSGYVGSFAAHNTRVPAGHPEGYLEAFANIYRNFSLTLNAKRNGETPTKEMLDFPTIAEGVRGMAFIDSVVASAKSTEKWTEFKV